MRKGKPIRIYKFFIDKLFLFSSENSINNKSSNFPFQTLLSHWHARFSAYLLFGSSNTKCSFK